MKMRALIFLICASAIVLVILALHFRKRPEAFTGIVSPNLARVSISNSHTAAVQFSTNINSQNTGHLAYVMKQYKQRLINKAQATTEILSSENDIPIVFYGKVEDQLGDAVAGATVNFGVRVYNGYESTVKYGYVTSDANGLFTISGYKGERLEIGVKKAGYAWVSMNGSGIYSKLYPEDQRAHPDPNNPTVIKMWKLQGAEPLVGINKSFKLPYNAEPLFFDLLTGNVVASGGDLEVVVTRAPGIIAQRKEDHRDWSIKLIPVSGGILETDFHTAQVTFEAPEDDYQDSFVVQMKHDDPAWFDNVYKTFFMTSRNGQVYSKFSLGFMINDDPSGTMWFQFKGVANASRSRNWEATAPSQ